MIFVPPEAPTTRFTIPSELTTILGHMEDSGRFPGFIKLAGDAGTPKALTVFGVEKSSISLLNRIPVRFPTTLDPKLKQIDKFDYPMGKNCAPFLSN